MESNVVLISSHAGMSKCPSIAKAGSQPTLLTLENPRKPNRMSKAKHCRAHLGSSQSRSLCSGAIFRPVEKAVFFLLNAFNG